MGKLVINQNAVTAENAGVIVKLNIGVVSTAV